MIESAMAGRSRPPVHLLESEYEALSALALRLERDQPQVAEMLLGELDRAELHGSADLPAGTVTMGSLVDFIDEGSGARRSVQLVFPQQADIEAGRISILTPIGAGLIGLRAGNSITWPDRDGHERRLRIVDVRLPEAARAS